MSGADEQRLLDFLEGRLADEERAALLARLEAEPALAARLRQAAAGLEAVQSWAEATAERSPPEQRPAVRVSPWWVAGAVAATAVLAVPITVRWSGGRVPTDVVAAGQPASPQPSFVLLLQGRWPDAAAVDAAETRRRAREYWAWTDALARAGVLVAAGDLRWEPGARVDARSVQRELDPGTLDDPGFPVGMFAVRVGSYEEAVALARACPHVRYGGTVAVRRVGGGFVTVPGMDDWAE